MELLQYLLPDSNRLHFENCEIDTDARHLTLSLSSNQSSAQCPLCAIATKRIHSQYERTLADLPCVNFSLTLMIQVGKFFCDNSACIRRIFTERLPELAAPWARKTVRLVQQLQAIGLALGGAAGARLCQQLGYSACGSTLLNQLKKLSMPSFEVPKILGVDDFAFRKGHQYGTILVDLERHQPIALLPDRKAETLANWLTQHPGVEVLSRDRAQAYKSGMTEGAPEAIQVADRFHLVQNLGETLEKLINGYSTELKEIEAQQTQSSVGTATDLVVVTAKPTATLKAQQKTQAVHQQRVERYWKIQQLREQQWSQKDIAQEVGVSIRTVRRSLSQPSPSATPSRRSTFGVSLLNPYKPELLEWWNAGIKEAKVLMNLLQQKGYKGSQRTLTRYLSRLREAQGLPPTRAQTAQNSPQVIDPQSPPLTARRASFLILQSEDNRDPADSELLAQIVARHPHLSLAVDLADEFLQLLRQQQADAFDAWLMKALSSSLNPFQKFAEGLISDYAAVKASMMSDVSNGPVEGLINRLKMMKRQMYGRAGLELLSKRFIMAQ